MKHSSPWILRAVACALCAFIGSSHAAGGGGGREGPDTDAVHAQADYQAGITAINQQRWADAIKALERHVWRNDRDADGHNYLAFSYRKSGKLDDAFKHYKRALAIDPKHLGAHEYIGEAYVMAGQPQEARKHLDRLASLCGTQCEQYRDLSEAIDRGRVSMAK
jgi:tetratricopeptide (TPR) repeat protein